MMWLGVTFADNMWLGVLENKQETLVLRVEVSGGSTIVGLGKCFIMESSMCYHYDFKQTFLYGL